MSARDVILWALDEVMIEEDQRRVSTRVTDVFYRNNRPSPGALMLGIGGVGNDTGDAGAVVLIGVARRSQQVATGKDRTSVTPVFRLPKPVPVKRLHDALPQDVKRRIDLLSRMPHPLAPKRLPPQGGAAVVGALQQLSPAVGQWIAALREAGEPLAGPHAARLREERDAVSLAIDISGVSAPDDLLYTPGDGLSPSEPFGATVNPLYLTDNPLFVADNEDDLLAEDLRRFDPHGQLQMRSSSIARFTDDQFTLTITNVNRKPLEKALGVDLIYYDELEQIFTLVQYKRMTRRAARQNSGIERWAHTGQAELEEQLQRMDIGLNEPVNSGDWRMVPSPFWFKFVRDEDFTPGDPFVLKGMYVPADYLQRAIADGSLRTGPRTGFEVTYSNTRYLPREVFVALVRRGFAGTTRAGSAAVLEVASQQARTREVVLVRKTPRREFDHPTRAYRVTEPIF
ncbi:hypothetical protein OG598_12110 [Micromonospora sp. NBC_00330]|uniref:hypothetical protein n=1 Tax=Micromonospora sp. NBC_00330 TaxID=2903585 RepID=UPI002E2885ED|nr:hypothetical protein [Micromonospora sp. NBC_00330]